MAAWTGRAVGTSVDIGAAVDELVGAPPGTGALIDRLGQVGESLGMEAFNGSAPFFAVMHPPLPILGQLDRDAAHRALGELTEARRRFSDAGTAGETTRWSLVSQEMAAACRATELGLRCLMGDQPSRRDYIDVLDSHRSAWLTTSRAGGLEDSMARLKVPS